MPFPEPTSEVHTLFEQSWLWHWFAPPHTAPVGNCSEQFPESAQNSLEPQSESILQPAPHFFVSALQVLSRHCSESLHGPFPVA